MAILKESEGKIQIERRSEEERTSTRENERGKETNTNEHRLKDTILSVSPHAPFSLIPYSFLYLQLPYTFLLSFNFCFLIPPISLPRNFSSLLVYPFSIILLYCILLLTIVPINIPSHLQRFNEGGSGDGERIPCLHSVVKL